MFTYFNVSVYLIANNLIALNLITEHCLSYTNPWAVFIGSIPALLRFFQCLQRWIKTGKANPHLVNALKYITIVIPFWLIYAKRLEGKLFYKI